MLNFNEIHKTDEMNYIKRELNFYCQIKPTKRLQDFKDSNL